MTDMRIDKSPETLVGELSALRKDLTDLAEMLGEYEAGHAVDVLHLTNDCRELTRRCTKVQALLDATDWDERQ